MLRWTGGQLIKTARSPRATVASVASGTVAEIYDRILTDIVGGHRPIGAPIRDREVAAELGVSRTPVREAMLLLR